MRMRTQAIVRLRSPGSPGREIASIYGAAHLTVHSPGQSARRGRRSAITTWACQPLVVRVRAKPVLSVPNTNCALIARRSPAAEGRMTQPPITRTARTDWSSRREHKRRRLERVAPYVEGKLVRRDAIVAALEALLSPGDRVVLEGDNQKQADFLSRALAQV